MHFTDYYRPIDKSIHKENFLSKLKPITDWKKLIPGDLIFSNRAQSIVHADTFVELTEEGGYPKARYNAIGGTFLTRINHQDKEWYHYDEELAIELLMNTVDKLGRNLLTSACMNEDQLLVKKLLDKGVNVNFSTNERQAAICYTVQNHDMELTKLLVHHGADLQVVDEYEQNLLHYAAHNKENITDKVNMFRYLIEAGISLHKRDTDGNTPLITLTEFSNRDDQNAARIAKYLIENGANANDRDTYNVTVLTNSLTIDNIKLAQVLLENGADINEVNPENNKAIVEFIKSQEAIDLFEKYKHQLTPENLDLFLQIRLKFLFQN